MQRAFMNWVLCSPAVVPTRGAALLPLPLLLLPLLLLPLLPHCHCHSP